LASEILNSRQIWAVEKIGDVLIPGNQEFPSFSGLGCVEHIDIVLEPLPEQDLKDLKMLFSVLSFFPKFGILLFWNIIGALCRLPGALGALSRQIQLGLKGLIMSLYYSGKTGRHYEGETPPQKIGFEVNVYIEDIS